MDATRATEERIMGSIFRRLSRVTEQVRKVMVRAHVTDRPVPALNRNIARLTAAMRWANRAAVERTPGLQSSDTKSALDWRLDKIRSLRKVVVADEGQSSLGVLVALAQQAEKFGSDLSGKVSDALVSNHTEQMTQECGPDQVLIWEPERDACVKCLKYAGQYRSANASFPAGQSFDPKAPAPKGTIPGPPAHPRCRCNLAVIPRAAAQANSKALQREAQRSILKGWALDSESDAVRMRAARDLLNSGAIVPKSVIDEARRRLKSGQPFIRDVP